MAVDVKVSSLNASNKHSREPPNPNESLPETPCEQRHRHLEIVRRSNADIGDRDGCKMMGSGFQDAVCAPQLTRGLSIGQFELTQSPERLWGHEIQ